MRNTSSQPRAGQTRRLFNAKPADAPQTRAERVAQVIDDLGGLPHVRDLPCTRCGASPGRTCDSNNGRPHAARSAPYAIAVQKLWLDAVEIVDANRDGLEP